MIAINRRLAGKRNRAAGAAAEQLVAAELIRIGYRFVERCHTPWRIARNAQGRIVGATPMEKVSGDFRCLTEAGRSVLVEVKYRPSRLVYSDLEPHQWAALQAHDAAGGLSLIAWVHQGGIRILQWDELAPRGSITTE